VHTIKRFFEVDEVDGNFFLVFITQFDDVPQPEYLLDARMKPA